MAVGFQRRNVGVLMDLPQLGGDGTDAFVDYTQNPVGEATADETDGEEDAPRAVRGEVLPPQGEGGPAADMVRTEEAARALIEAADRQRKAAGSPLNRVLSGIGGVLNAPFAFLEGAFSGGDMTNVTAPFRPQQNADMRFQQTVLGIQKTLSDVRENYAQMAASQASAIRQAMSTKREETDAAFADLGRLAGTTLFVDPNARQANWQSGLAMLAERYPSLKPLVANVNVFTPTLAARLIGQTKDESANKLLQEYAYGDKSLALGDGLGAILPSRPGAQPQVVGPDSPVLTARPFITDPQAAGAAPVGIAPPPLAGPPVNAAPVNGTATTPQDLINMGVDLRSIPLGNPLEPPAPAIDVSRMTDDELEAFIRSQGGE